MAFIPKPCSSSKNLAVCQAPASKLVETFLKKELMMINSILTCSIPKLSFGISAIKSIYML